jgi:hypothetical protein
MSYFRSEAEALHLALSPDGLEWHALAGNRPVYKSPLGAKSIRDPFIYPDGTGRYHLLSTNGWTSDHLLHAVSVDLVEWTDAALVPVMVTVPGVKNVWAPEAFFDAANGVHRLIWSSTTGHATELDVHGYDHRIWSVNTTDFKTYSTPEIFFDPGYNVIDANVVTRPEGGYLMAYKDERDPYQGPTPVKAIRIATADSALGPWKVQEQFVTPDWTEGPTIFRRSPGHGNDWVLFYDLFTAGHFGAARSTDGLTWEDITSQVTFPPGPRHAAVIEIEDGLAEGLRKEFS